MPWKRNTWVDDDGSLTVGTPFDAAHMNNIEDGVEKIGTDLSTAQVTLGNHSASITAIAASAGKTNALASAASAGALAASAAAVGASAGALAASKLGGSALTTGQNANKLAAIAEAGALQAELEAEAAEIAAGNAEVVGIEARENAQVAAVLGENAGTLAASGLETGQQANVAAGSALATGQKANVLAVSASAALVAEQWVRASGDLVRPSVVEADFIQLSASGTGTIGGTALPSATRPAAALVLIAQDYTGGSADQIISVVYGEQTMPRIGEARINGKGVLYAHLLTKKIKPGKQLWSISVKGAAKKRAMLALFNAPPDAKIGYMAGSGTATAATLLLESGVNVPVWTERLMYGLDAANKVVSGSGEPTGGTYFQDEFLNEAFGSASFTSVARSKSPWVPGKIPTLEFNAPAGTAHVGLWTWLGLIKDWGELTELPEAASCLIGDVCHFVADAANNIVWDLVFDNLNPKYPWRKTGGAPMRVDTVGGNVVSGSPGYYTGTLTVPCACLGTVSFGTNLAQNNNLAGATQIAIYLRKNTVNVDTTNAIGLFIANGQFGGGPINCQYDKGAYAKNDALQLYTEANNGATWNVINPYLILDPQRVG